MSITEEEFRNMCQRHDLTYDFSDDHRVWMNGQKEFDRIKAIAKELPRETAVRIWNEVVDTKIVPECRTQFYWKA